MTKIRVGIRIKPERDDPLKDFSYRSSRESTKIDITVSGNRSEFHIDNVFEQSCSQGEVFTVSTQPIIDAVMEGFNGTIFAYGQTGILRQCETLLLISRITHFFL
jgi:hypothetical protein